MSELGISTYESGGSSGSYHPLTVSGATPKTLRAIEDIHNYLENNGVYEKLDQKLRYMTNNKDIEISFDRELGPNVLGQTERKCLAPYCNWEISLNPEAYGESYLDFEDGSDEQLITIAIQGGVLTHEKGHKNMLESKKVNKAIYSLENKGYGDNNIRGFLEMLTEKYSIDSLVDAGLDDIAWIRRRTTPYRRALEAGDNIDSFFVYGENEEYRGLEGFVEALADGALESEKDIVEKYLGGLEVKLVDTPEPYAHGKYENPIRKYIEDLFSGERKEYGKYGGLVEPVKAKEPARIDLGVMPPAPVASSPRN